MMNFNKKALTVVFFSIVACLHMSIFAASVSPQPEPEVFLVHPPQIIRLLPGRELGPAATPIVAEGGIRARLAAIRVRARLAALGRRLFRSFMTQTAGPTGLADRVDMVAVQQPLDEIQPFGHEPQSRGTSPVRPVTARLPVAQQAALPPGAIRTPHTTPEGTRGLSVEPVSSPRPAMAGAGAGSTAVSPGRGLVGLTPVRAIMNMLMTDSVDTDQLGRLVGAFLSTEPERTLSEKQITQVICACRDNDHLRMLVPMLQGSTLLEEAFVVAVSSGDTERAELLVKWISHPDLHDKYGTPVLVLAIEQKMDAVVKRLLMDGLDPDTKGRCGKPALWVAIERATPDESEANYRLALIASHLLERGARIQLTHYSSSAELLKLAVNKGSVVMLGALIESGRFSYADYSEASAYADERNAWAMKDLLDDAKHSAH